MIEELARLVDTNPADTAEILELLIDANAPNYDLDDKLKKLIQKLGKMGFREQAIRSIEKLRKSLPGTLDLYQELLAMARRGDSLDLN